MEIFSNWMNNLVSKPSFHTLIKKIPIIGDWHLMKVKVIIYDLVAGFVYSQVLLAIIELRLIDFLITGKKKLDDIQGIQVCHMINVYYYVMLLLSIGLLKR